MAYPFLFSAEYERPLEANSPNSRCLEPGATTRRGSPTNIAGMAAPTPLENLDFWGSRGSTRRSLRGSASRSWGVGPDNVFGRNQAQSGREGGDDEEALKWAALEKMPTYDRLHTTILERSMGSRVVHEEIDVRHIGFAERQQIIDNLLKVTEEDNERFLKKLRNRIDRYAGYRARLSIVSGGRVHGMST